MPRLPLLALLLATVLRGSELPADPRFAAAAATSRAADGIAMVVMIDGRIVREEYPNGGAASRATELASGTKSFSGVLALCAVVDGLLALDEKVSATLTEWRDDARREITLRQLLTLTSGIPGGEGALRGGIIPTYGEAVQLKPVAEPGAKFSYGPNPFQVFGEVMRRKLEPRHETVMQYIERRILVPLDIKPQRWRQQRPGEPNIPSGVALSARDWAKFGEAIRLDAKGLLPPGKVGQCFEGTKANPGYGLTWWLPAKGSFGAQVKRPLLTGLPRDVWMAAGAGGQRLVVVPSLHLVAVRLAPLHGEQLRPFNDAKWLRELLGPVVAPP